MKILSMEREDVILGLIVSVVFIGLIFLLLRLNKHIFKKIHERRKELQLVFFEKVCSVAIIIAGAILTISVWGGFDSLWKTLVGGTAVVSAVVAFAAQDVIKDILAGLMISVNKPFEIGNRIELEDGTVGVVKDITMRHVVLVKLDTVHAVIPNSKLNSMSIINYSYMTKMKSARFDFHVAYDTDMKKAMEVTLDAIKSSKYSIPGKKNKDGKGSDYAPIYFMAFEDSSLKLTTTVYYGSETASEVVISDINMRVNEAYRENGIEVPYKYVNVVERN
ncbi:MAG: mechanosensitive ion channel family protein [Saccharofermentans sp.]|nr:mechanosensitive ion channel family protein [Saccharofermentans sp.]